MPVLSVRIPQIGEGLQEARLVAILKQPGDKIKRDEHIYQMETDKAVMDVESPYEGVLVEWTAAVDSIIPIGGEVAKMEVADSTAEQAAGHGAPAPAAATSAPATAATGGAASAGSRNAAIPPRTRAYAKEKGVSDEALEQLAATKPKLMPADIDAFLAGNTSAPTATAPANEPKSVAGKYTEALVPGKQRVLNSRMVRSNSLVVPGTITCQLLWEPIEAMRAHYKEKGGDFQPSAFTMLAYAVTRAMVDHPSFRSTLVGDSIFRTYDHVSLGIAVALPGDELVTAVVEKADTLSWQDFSARARERISEARGGKDQANEEVTVSLTNMQNFGLRDAVPVVVAPSIATLFIGEVYGGIDPNAETPTIRKYVNLALTTDHRVVNGVGMANFLAAIKSNCENISNLIQS